MIMQTCLAVLLRRKLHQKLPSVTHWGSNLSLHFFVATSVAESRTWFYFSQRLRQWFYRLFHRCSVTPPCNSSRDALFDLPIRILIILSSVLLGRSFASCWQSHCCVTPVRVTAVLCVWTLRDKFHEKLSKVAAPQLIRCFKMGNQSYSGCHANKTDSINRLFSLIFQSEENSSSGNCCCEVMWSDFAFSSNQHPKGTVKVKTHKSLRTSWTSQKNVCHVS